MTVSFDKDIPSKDTISSKEVPAVISNGKLKKGKHGKSMDNVITALSTRSTITPCKSKRKIGAKSLASLCQYISSNAGFSPQPKPIFSGFHTVPAILESNVNDASNSNALLNRQDQDNLSEISSALDSSLFEDSYTLSNNTILGKGGFGTVRLCTENSSERVFAVKIVPLARTSKRKRVRKEIGIFKLCAGHENFVTLVDTFEDNDFAYIVMDWIPYGTVNDKVQKLKWLSETDTRLIIRDVCNALQWLHENNICHGDVKMQNVLLNGSGAKLIDFDTAFVASFDIAVPQMSGLRGTPDYFAPELVKSYLDGSKYNQKIDVWSVGVMMYGMLQGQLPFTCKCKQHKCLFKRRIGTCKDCLSVLLDNIQRKRHLMFQGPKWIKVSQKAKDLLDQLLTVNPSVRPTIEQVLNHSWFHTYEIPRHTKIFNIIFRSWEKFCTLGTDNTCESC